MVNMVTINSGMSICDPASGVGKFLLEAASNVPFEVKNGQLVSGVDLYGFEKQMSGKDDITTILAKANMLIYFSKLFKDNNNIDEVQYLATELLNKVFYSSKKAPEIDANFEINKRLLPPSLAIDSTGEIAPDSIPAQTKVTDLSIFWDYSIKNLADKTFWKDLTHRFTNWVITQVPSIIILTLIFIGLLRLLNYIVKKLNKAAKRRVHLNENIDDAEGNKRIETLSGIILGVGKIFLWTIFVLIMLSKFNINIGPILASAGIVGLAVGFGAQELVRDFISGFFILLEDQIRTGDVAIINGTTGTVEKIEMRTTTLRDASGVVHIFQNGKINSLSNMTKGWSAIVVDIGVAYKEDTDHVNEIMKQVGDELMKDAAWQSILMGVDLWGVDSFGDSSVDSERKTDD